MADLRFRRFWILAPTLGLPGCGLISCIAMG